ncbi:MAG: hypothetical protein AB1696_24815 [Planctomycetota bacterium]
MNTKLLCLIIALVLFFSALRPASACDVAYIKGQPSSAVGFPGGRDSRRCQHYVVLAPSGQCSGMVLGWSSCLTDRCIVFRPSSNAQFPTGEPSGIEGYVLSCPSSCLSNLLATRSEIIGYLTGPKDLSGYIVKGGTQAIRGFVMGCPSTVLRGFLVAHPTSAVTTKIARSSTNNTYHIVSQTSYMQTITAGRTARSTKCFVASGPSRTFTHCLVHPRTNNLEFVAGSPSSVRPGYVGGPDSRPLPEYVADTQCGD